MSMQPSAELISLLDQINASAGGDYISPPKVGGFSANPFVGLRPFESEEDMLFFGRREQTIELLQQLHRSRFLAVVGSSGCGKSSLIRAGLIPKLKAGFLVDDRDRWTIAVMRPGESPLYNLALTVQLTRDPSASDENVTSLTKAIVAEGAPAIIQRLSPLWLQRDLNLLLLVDQFEEIFRFGSYALTDEQTINDPGLLKRRNECSEFVAIMLELAKGANLPVYVVMTMRSDFLGDCDAFFGLPEAMNQSQYLVPRLTRQQRQEAIEKPILLVGQRIAPRLLDRVLNDMGEESDQLPIMQHALMRTWDEWKKASRGEVDLEHYEAAGTIADALWKDAEKALSETGEPELTKRIFQLLTDKDQHGRRIRRPAYLSEIVEVTNADHDKVMTIIECFRRDNRSFLMLSEGQDETELLVDISHESLIRQWKTLRDWVDEEAESRAMYLRLAEAASRHQSGKEGLWTNPALSLALDWRKEKKPNDAWGQRYHREYKPAMAFLDKSRRRHRSMFAIYAALAVLAVVLVGGLGVYRQRAKALTANQRIFQLQQEEQREREVAALQHKQEIETLESRKQQEITVASLAASQHEREIAEAARRDADIQRKIAEDNGRKLAGLLMATKAARDDAETQRGIAEQKSKDAEEAKNRAEGVSKQLTVQLAETLRQRALYEDAARQEREARKQEAEQRIIAENALRQKDIEKSEKEKAQGQVAVLEKERTEATERRESYEKGKTVMISHPFLGKVPYRKGETGALEVDQDWIDENIVSVQILELKGIKGLPASGKVRFHRCAIAQLQAALREIKEKGLVDRVVSWDGSFIGQAPSGLRTAPNSHNFGIAFDINLSFNRPLLQGRPPLPATVKGSVMELVPIFEKHGFQWGGDPKKKFGREPAHFQLARLDKSDQCPRPIATSTSFLNSRRYEFFYQTAATGRNEPWLSVQRILTLGYR
jgi:energy-coupling factor transporter ATP-binding protein EcfA2